MLRHDIIVLYRESCDCGDQIRHNNGGNYHAVDKLHLFGDDNNVYCVILEETSTRESFPGDQYETLVFQNGKFCLEDKDWADNDNIVNIDGYPILFRQGEAEIVYQNPQAFIETHLNLYLAE